MNKYKLYNTVRKELINTFGFKPHNIKQISFSYKVLRELLEKYYCEYIVDNYCCYGEDTCCWQDVESSWLRTTKRNNKEVNQLCLKDFKSDLKHIIKENKLFSIYDRKMIISERKDTVWVIIPLRDVYRKDYAFCFNKTRTLN